MIVKFRTVDDVTRQPTCRFDETANERLIFAILRGFVPSWSPASSLSQESWVQRTKGYRSSHSCTFQKIPVLVGLPLKFRSVAGIASSLVML